MTQLTEHFSDEELGVVGAEDRLIQNATFLCEKVLEPIHDKWGTVRVHDGYRDPGHNARVGGKATSFHMFVDGRAAADIDCPATGVKVLFDWLRLASGELFDKVIMELNKNKQPVTVHVQIDRLNPPRREAYTGHTGAALGFTPVPEIGRA